MIILGGVGAVLVIVIISTTRLASPRLASPLLSSPRTPDPALPLRTRCLPLPHTEFCRRSARRSSLSPREFSEAELVLVLPAFLCAIVLTLHVFRF